jgi:hemolysin III
MSERWSLGRMQNPIRGLLHGSAAVVAVAGLASMVVAASSWPMRLAAAVFGLAMVALFTTSSLYHSIPWSRLWKKRMQRLDHSMIYVFIAATYTPPVLVVLDSPWRWAMLCLVWGIAAVGVAQHVFFPTENTGFSVALATTLGWIGVFLAWPFIDRLGFSAFVLVILGGVFYTVGMVFLVTNRPRLWPRVFSYHEAFHVLVVLATAAHFTFVTRYVIPLG